MVDGSDIGDNHKVELGKMASGLWVSPRALALTLRQSLKQRRLFLGELN